MTSGAWPSGPLQFLPVPAIEKSPRIAVFKRFSGGFPVQPGRCPPRRAAADVRPPAAPGHKKRRRPPSTPSRSMNVRMCGPFPPEICPFPLKNGGFPTLPPVLPVYPGFSIILSPYRYVGNCFPFDGAMIHLRKREGQFSLIFPSPIVRNCYICLRFFVTFQQNESRY